MGSVGLRELRRHGAFHRVSFQVTYSISDLEEGAYKHGSEEEVRLALEGEDDGKNSVDKGPQILKDSHQFPLLRW